MTVDELSERMSLAEYWNWSRFSSLEPFPSERTDLAGALVATTLANIHRGKNGAARKLEDFLLVQKGLDHHTVTSDDREAAHLRATMATLGGKLK